MHPVGCRAAARQHVAGMLARGGSTWLRCLAPTWTLNVCSLHLAHPQLNPLQREKEYVVRADMPGAKKVRPAQVWCSAQLCLVKG